MARLHHITALFALFLLPTAALPSTMTFDNADSISSSYSEDGILATTVTGHGIGASGRPGMAHLDDGGTGYAPELTFTTAQRFTAQSFDLRPLSSAYQTCTETFAPDGSTTSFSCVRRKVENVLVQGFRNGIEVATLMFDMFKLKGHITLDAAFSNLDSLRIGFALPYFQGDIVASERKHSWAVCNDSPCTHYDIDNVALAAVPLAPAGPLLAAALGFPVLLRRQRRG